MKILVTGSEGFIGKALVSKLILSGYELVGFDFKDGDIAQKGILDHLKNEGIGHVIHLAAKTFVPESWKEPFDFYRVNLLGTTNVLDFCRSNDASLTYISSYLYGAPEYLPVDENHPLKAHNPYSHSKIIADDTCRYFRDHFNIPVTIFRPFNVYGPGQELRFLIPKIIKQLQDPSIPAIEVMDLKPKRDYLFIDDMVDALILSISGPKDTYNLGSGQSESVKEIIDMLISLTGIHKPIKSSEQERTDEINDLYADITKVRAQLGWEPKVSLEEGLRRSLR